MRSSLSRSSASPSLTGTMIIATLLIAAGLMGFYQMVYIPAKAPPPVPPEYLNPPKTTQIVMVPEAYLPNNPTFFEPKEIVVVLGINNTLTWKNTDIVAHTATSDTGASMTFDSKFVLPGEAWSSTFTKPGTVNYHCTPHPWMRASVTVVELPKQKTAA